MNLSKEHLDSQNSYHDYETIESCVFLYDYACFCVCVCFLSESKGENVKLNRKSFLGSFFPKHYDAIGF